MALVCKVCSYKQNDEVTIRLMTEKHPGYEEHDIPYRCGACMDRDEDNTDTKGD